MKNNALYGANNSRVYSRRSIHAEEDAINRYLRLNNKDKKVDIIVIRVNDKGDLKNSKPCQNCMRVMANSGIKIKNIYYSTDTGDIVCERFTHILRDIDGLCISRSFR